MFSFGIKDVIDIFLVALLLYYIYRLMKESSSANIFTGILIFILTWIFVSQVFEMRLLGSILDQMISIGSLGLIILFQEEIRQFFSTIGARHSSRRLIQLFRGKKKEETFSRKEVMAVVMASMNMSKKKVGALIIVERGVGLREYVRSGETINADINQRLIENIFFKNSPLHDGAMIISDRRIKATSCILPVSQDLDIPRRLGLRHRAALGITQKTDAFAIIVSEETGGISVAENGKFRLDLTAEQLERELTRSMQ